ncbi:MAG TPA: hypothetical protein VFB22_17935 [Candidatus Baltobacteraceae bacterium]|nr:hypothetical protein [Candidatus Baltobacteraceae bacterium]
MSLDDITRELDAIAASTNPGPERLARADALLRKAARISNTAAEVYDEALELFVRLSADEILSGR